MCVSLWLCVQLAPTSSPSLVNSMKAVGNPVKTCDKVYALIQSLTSQIRRRLEDPKSAGLSLDVADIHTHTHTHGWILLP